MSTAVSTQYVTLESDPCAQCGERHHVTCIVQLRAVAEPEGVALFGGLTSHPVAYVCPKTGKPTTTQVHDPPDGTIVGVADPASAAIASGNGSAPGISSGLSSSGLSSSASSTFIEGEFGEWIKASRATALDFCKTMLTTSTGAIAVYFALFKYLGIETVGRAAMTRAYIAPPLLYFATAIVFMFALRPWMSTQTPKTFEAFRAKRLKWLNGYIIGGVVLFGVATVLSFVFILTAL